MLVSGVVWRPPAFGDDLAVADHNDAMQSINPIQRLDEIPHCG